MMKLRHLGYLLLVALIAAAAPRPASAQELAKDASTFVQSLGDQAIKVITDKSLNPADREKKFHQIFVDHFDVQAIGRFVLGRYWRTASDAQKTEFLKLFEDMIVKTYNNRFTEYKGEQFVVTGSRADGDSAMVTTNVTRPG